MRWRRKRMDLAERLRPYVKPWPLPEPMVDADPIRIFLIRWMIETGDPADVVARGFDLDRREIESILNRKVSFISTAHDHELRVKLDLHQHEPDR